MANKSYTENKTKLINLTKNASFKINPIYFDISGKINGLFSKLKSTYGEEAILIPIYDALKGYPVINIYVWRDEVKKELEKNLKIVITNTLIPKATQGLQQAISDDKIKRKEDEEAERKRKEEHFEKTKLTILKKLGYVEGKRGSQDSSPDIEKWMITNASDGLSKTVRGFWINDIQKINNMGALNNFLRQNRLVFKDDHLLRGR